MKEIASSRAANEERHAAYCSFFDRGWKKIYRNFFTSGFSGALMYLRRLEITESPYTSSKYSLAFLRHR
jgi:hypothetical protein